MSIIKSPSLVILLCLLYHSYTAAAAAANNNNCLVNVCYQRTEIKLNEMRAEQNQVLDNFKGTDYLASSKYKAAFDNLKQTLDEIKRILENVHVNEETLKILHEKLADLQKHAEYLDAKIEPLNAKSDIAIETLEDYEDKFLELSQILEEVQEKYDLIKKEEITLKESNVEGALNYTREALEKVKRSQEMFVDRRVDMENIGIVCDSINKFNLNWNGSSEMEEMLHDRNKELDILYINSTTFNNKTCQKVDFKCDELDCKQTLCIEKAKLKMIEVQRNLENEGEKLLEVENEINSVKNQLEDAYDEALDAKSMKNKTAKGMLQTKTKLNNTQNLLQETIKKFDQTKEVLDLEVSSAIQEIKNLTSGTLQQKLDEDINQLKELTVKINETLKGITEVGEIINAAADGIKQSNQLLLEALEKKKKADKIKQETEELSDSLRETDAIITNVEALKHDIQSRINNTQEDFNELDTVSPELQKTYKIVFEKYEVMDAEKMAVEKQIADVDINAIQITKDLDAVKIHQQHANAAYEKANQDLLLTEETLDKHLMRTEEKRKKMELVMERMKRLNEKISHIQDKLDELEDIHKPDTLQIEDLEKKLQDLHDKLNNYSNTVLKRGNYYQECTSTAADED